MAACPWCNAATSDPLAPCPRCGRTKDDRSGLAQAPGGAIRLDDVPDLDLPPRASKGAIPKATSTSSPGAEAAGTGWMGAKAGNGALSAHDERTLEDDGDSDDLGDEGGPRLELDLSGGPPLIVDPPSEGAKAPAAGGAKASLGALAKAPVPGTDLAAPVDAASVPRILLDPYEARAVADYGDVPDAWWKTPFYAYRVLRRRPELKELAELKALEAERAKRAAEEALLSFAEVVRYDAEKLGAYEESLQAVRVAEQVLGKRDAVLAAETDAHKQRQAESNAKLAELEAQLSHIQIEERQVADELAEAGALLKRAEVRVKRIEAEMRTAIAQAEPAAALGAMRGPGQ